MTVTPSSHPKPLWTPSRSFVERSNLTRFAKRYAPQCDLASLQGYRDLHAWSIREAGDFWRAVWDFGEVIGEPGDVSAIPGASMLDWSWFPQARFNYAQNLLHPNRLSDPAFASEVAIVACDEQGHAVRWSRVELCQSVISVAQFFRSQGITAGDRIAAVVPNNPCAIIGHLAAAAIGAIWSSCSPDFGSNAIRDRFGQIEPKLLITSQQTTYNGKSVRPIDRVREVLPQLPTVQTVLVEGTDASTELAIAAPSSSSIHWFSWADALGHRASSPWEWQWFPFDHPLCILYSSGTTGPPKCIVHRAGGALLQHLKEHQLHCDLKPGDTMLYYTTTGWMMWNWLVSGLASQATIVAYDGSPIAPNLDSLWSVAQKLRVTHFGASARYFAVLEKSGHEPKRLHTLQDLRCVLSTGSPLLPETFDWIYRAIKQDVHLASISGGTDILSCFVLGNPNLPVHRGEIQCKGLGMDVRVLDASHHKTIDESGELVCAHAFPSMPVGFWKDTNSKKYRASYFESVPGVWCHGDWARETEHGGFIIYGRSDATLNPGGVRIGTAEIYQQVESFPEIAEAVATAWKTDGDEKIVLFVRLVSGHALSQELCDAIRTVLRQRCSPRHVPSIIESVPDLPRTISGKLSEIAVRNAICGTDLGNAGALANPDSLDYFRAWRPTSLKT